MARTTRVVGTMGIGKWSWYRSMTSVRRRRRLASAARSTALAVTRQGRTFVATKTSSRIPRIKSPRSSSDRPPP